MDTTKTVDIISTILSENAFAKFFPHPETWAAWFAFHRALYGLKMDENELEMFRQCTGRVSIRPMTRWRAPFRMAASAATRLLAMSSALFFAASEKCNRTMSFNLEEDVFIVLQNFA